jgi:hypothetical protein
LDGVNAGLNVLNFRDGKSGVFVAQARRALADVDEPVLVTIDERLEQDAANESEDGRVGSDAERQVRMTMTANPGVRRREWSATLRSRKNDMVLVPSASGFFLLLLGLREGRYPAFII